MRLKKGSSEHNMDSPDLSAIDKASFIEGLQQNHGNPLHSTAMEDDLDSIDGEQTDKGKSGRKDNPQTSKNTVKQRGAPKKRKETERDEETEGKGDERKKKRRKNIGATVKPKPMMNQQTRNGKKSNRESGNEMTSDLQSEESDAGATKRRRGYVLSSDEMTEEEDVSWNPSPKKAKVYSLGRIRKSSSGTAKSRKSSGSAAAKAEETKTAEQSVKRHAGQRGTDLEVVLDSFIHFCEQYSETVDSKAVKHSIESFSSNVKWQILEKISASKDFRNLKRENGKVASLIRKKTQKLLDAKHELMRAERQTWLLQKEKTELELRLADLRRSQAFLHDIREVNRQYLDYRKKHHREKETYGATSLPALLLETRHIQSTENQLRGINNQLEKRVKID